MGSLVIDGRDIDIDQAPPAGGRNGGLQILAPRPQPRRCNRASLAYSDHPDDQPTQNHLLPARKPRADDGSRTFIAAFRRRKIAAPRKNSADRYNRAMYTACYRICGDLL
jgi:hypothetical protein